MSTEPQPAAQSVAARLGLLRLALLLLVFLNILLPAADAVLGPFGVGDEMSAWQIIVVYITPVMAPLLLVVVFFDYLMSRIRASDADGGEAVHYRVIARIELAVIGLTLLYWVPFFVLLMR